VPILPAEPDIFPADLFDAEGLSGEAIGQWWALYTMPRREKELMRRLRSLGVAHYSPLIRRQTRSAGGRTRVSFVPLFPSYVFLCGSDSQRYEAVKTNCICRCLEVRDQRQLVQNLRQVKLLVDCGAPLTPESRIRPGMRVRVRSGLLAGIEGTVIKRQGRQRLLVAVQFLQQGASVQLDDCQVDQLG
jgi:transcription antitermination factor NusG